MLRSRSQRPSASLRRAPTKASGRKTRRWVAARGSTVKVSVNDARHTGSPLQSFDGVTSLSAGFRALDDVVEQYGLRVLLAETRPIGAATALRVAIRLLCEEARRVDSHRAERLVVALHAAWWTPPSVRDEPVHADRDRLLATCIAHSIRASYAPSVEGLDGVGTGVAPGASA